MPRTAEQRIRALKTRQRLMAGPLFPALRKSVDDLGDLILDDEELPALFVALGRALDDAIEFEDELAEAVSDLVISLAVAGMARAFIELERQIKGISADDAPSEPEGKPTLAPIVMRRKVVPTPAPPVDIPGGGQRDPGES